MKIKKVGNITKVFYKEGVMISYILKTPCHNPNRSKEKYENDICVEKKFIWCPFIKALI